MDIVVKGQCLAIPSDTIHGFEQALSHVLQSAQLSVPNEGFWRNYVRLERVYNAVEVGFIICGFCLLILPNALSA